MTTCLSVQTYKIFFTDTRPKRKHSEYPPSPKPVQGQYGNPKHRDQHWKYGRVDVPTSKSSTHTSYGSMVICFIYIQLDVKPKKKNQYSLYACLYHVYTWFLLFFFYICQWLNNAFW